MKKVKSYVLMLKSGEIEDRIIRGITPEGGAQLQEILADNPPMFIKVKGRTIARSEIAQLREIY